MALADSELTAYSCGGSPGVVGICKFQRTVFPLSFALNEHKEPLHDSDLEPRNRRVKMVLPEVCQNILSTALAYKIALAGNIPLPRSYIRRQWPLSGR